MYKKIFTTIIMTICFLCQYIIMHIPLLQLILVVGFPTYLIVQAWMLKAFNFYENIKINIIANISFMFIISIFQLIQRNDFLWYFKDKIDLTNFIVVYWAMSSTMYFGLLFHHYFAKVFVPFLIQLLLCVIAWLIAYTNFYWIDANGIKMTIAWWSIFINILSIIIIFWINFTVTKWMSKKLIINKREVQ